MSIIFKFTADSSAVVRELEIIKTKMGELSWADFAMGIDAVLNLLGKVKAGVVAVFDAVVAPAAEMEQLSVKFETMLGSATKAAALMEKLRSYAATSPFDMKGVAEAASILLGFGVSAERIMAVMRRLGDMAAVSGASLQDLARIYGKINSVGAMDTVAIDMLSERGLNMRALLAARDGISVQEVKKRIERRAYGVDDLDYALRKETGSGGKYEGGAQKQANTVEGALGALSDQLFQMREKIGQSIVTPFREAVDYLSEELPRIYETLLPVVELLAYVCNFLLKHLPEIVHLLRSAALAVAVLVVKPAALASFKFAKALVVGIATAFRGSAEAALAVDVAVTKVKKTLQSIGKISWMLAITAAIEGGSYLWEKMSAKAEAAKETAEQIAAINEQEQQELEAENQARFERERENLEAAQKQVDELRELLNVTTKEKEFEKALDSLVAALVDSETRLRNISDLPEWMQAERRSLTNSMQSIYDSRYELRDALERRQQKEKADALVEKESAARTQENARREAESFAALTASQQRAHLLQAFPQIAAMDHQQFANVYDGRKIMEQAVMDAASTGEESVYKTAKHFEALWKIYEKTLEKEAQEAAKKKELNAKNQKALMARRAGVHHELKVLQASALGDDATVARLERESQAASMARELVAAGMSGREAVNLSMIWARRKKQVDESGNGRGVQMIASSLSSVGGGGVALRLGDAQLAVSRQQLTELKGVRALLDKTLNKMLPGIPVVA